VTILHCRYFPGLHLLWSGPLTLFLASLLLWQGAIASEMDAVVVMAAVTRVPLTHQQSSEFLFLRGLLLPLRYSFQALLFFGFWVRCCLS
jgi:hypothetical protein